MSKECMNSTKEMKCERVTEPGHIYCTPCRIANGGYLRYNQPAPKKRTKSTVKQEICHGAIRQRN